MQHLSKGAVMHSQEVGRGPPSVLHVGGAKALRSHGFLSLQGCCLAAFKDNARQSGGGPWAASPSFRWVGTRALRG